jgi:signal transduction histidine kinase
LAAEAALAFALGLAFFGLVAVTVVMADSDVLVIALATIYALAVSAIVRLWGVAYGVPAAFAGLLAYDWFQFPPTHAEEIPDLVDLVDLAVYIAVGVLVGELLALTRRRAAATETARRELADERAALRRVATLVASHVPPSEMFTVIAREAGLLLGAAAAHITRYDDDNATIIAASWTREGDGVPVGSRVALDGESVAGSVLRTRRPVRIRAAVGAPVFVDGRVWGTVTVASKDGPLPAESESRLLGFTELVTTAISNIEARAEVERLANEQAALRRVATLVARAVPASEVLEAIAREAGQLLGADATHIGRYDSDDTVTAVASWSPGGVHVPVGTTASLGGANVTTLVSRTGRPARMDSYAEVSGEVGAIIQGQGLRSSVGAPIVVDDRLWGVIVASSNEEPLGPDTEGRIAAFTELAATAISNTQAWAETRSLADEQSALRRVATLVARESASAEVFTVVAQEVGRILGVDETRMLRYEDDETATLLADWGTRERAVAPGTRVTLEGDSVASLVKRTQRPVRVDDYAGASGSLAAYAREWGMRAAIGAPIVVDGRLWGVIVAMAQHAEAIPPGTESRMEEFTKLVATAISNIEARSDLAASRARVVAAADDERRRVVRDLHDGAQQRLVHTIVTLKMARRALERHEDNAPRLMTDALEQAESAMVELRELARGILPSVLTWGGLPAGVEALASRMPMPVEVDVSVGRLAPAVEASAYFVVAEALTNVAKHAHARRAAVTAAVDGRTLQIAIEDDGVGMADPNGHGLLGLADRLASLDGSLRVVSAPADGTTVIATVPLPA